ncbi:MAG TPA: peptide ABC transporter substrate-binding protein [Thermodesulfobacteriota bacterium]|nr:peptide ABC transporter substrate-binding protein [Thermodesulfobacteriota bacterium]
MGRIKYVLTNFISLVLITILLLSCKGEGEASSDSANRDTLKINIGTEPPTLDWSLSTDSTSYTILVNIMNGLTKFGEDYMPEPALAEGWEISEDGKTYTFYLRKDVIWTDGKPLRAEDFEYSWKRLLNPATGADYAYFLYDIEGAEEYNTGKEKNPDRVSVRAVDDHTLSVKLKRPASYFPSLLSFMSTFPMRKDVVEKYGDKWTKPENIVTLGPFKISLWRHHERILLTENPKYWGAKPKIQKVEMIMNENPMSTLALYESGELDYLDGRGIPILEVPRLRLSPEFNTEPQFRGNYIAFNVKKPPFDNPLVRRAFSAAIDRERLVQLIQGAGVASTSWIPKGMLAYNPEIGIDFNPEKAKSWLAEAGYPNGKGFPRVAFLYPDVGNNRIVSEALQSMWKRYLGVEAELENQEWKVYLSTINTDPPPLHRAGWGADFPDPHNFMNLFECNSGNNRTRWCNSEYDRLVEKAAEERDLRKRIELYDEAQKILTQTDVPIAPMFISIQYSMIKPYVDGLEPNPLDLILFDKVSFGKKNNTNSK